MTDKSEKRLEHEKRMEEAAREMAAEGVKVDPSANSQIFVADIGTSVSSGPAGGSTSPKIVYHDRSWEQIRNAHPQLESGEVESLLEHVYGQSIYAAAPHFESFSKERIEEVLSWSEAEVEDYLFGPEWDGDE